MSAGLTREEFGGMFAQTLEASIDKPTNAVCLERPSMIVSRRKELAAISKWLCGHHKNGKLRCFFITGSHGSGKTHVVKTVGPEVEKQFIERSVGMRFVYVDCRINKTKYSILSEAGRSLDITSRNNHSDVILKQMREKLGIGLNMILVLDEIDKIVPGGRASEDLNDILCDLHRADASSGVGRLKVIGIANNVKFESILKSSTHEVLDKTNIVFKQYSISELRDIIRLNVDTAKQKFTDPAIELLAAKTYNRGSNARIALSMVEELTDVCKGGRIDDKAVRGLEEYEDPGLGDLLSSLHEHELIMLKGIVDLILGLSGQQGRIDPATLESVYSRDIYEYYYRFCSHTSQKPKTNRQIREYLYNLSELGIIETDTVGFRKLRRGRGLIIRLSWEPARLKSMLEEVMAGRHII